MTNEELKKKIIEIVLDTEITGIKVRNITGGISMAKAIADALIAAGIGDVSCLREHRVIAEYSLVPDDDNPYIIPNVPLRVTQLYSGEEVEQIVKEREEYKHRAEVAEKALNSACFILAKNYYVDGKEDWAKRGAECATFYREQAEKELAEEGKE